MTKIASALMLALFASLSLGASSALACGAQSNADAPSSVSATSENADSLLAMVGAQSEVSTTSARACHDEINCPPGDQCIGGTCVFQGQCHADVDCGAGRHCSGGMCH